MNAKDGSILGLTKMVDYNNCLIYATEYQHSLAYVLRLAEIAKKDFPGLTDDQIKVVQCSVGFMYHRGIQFSIPESILIMPAGYEEVPELTIYF